MNKEILRLAIPNILSNISIPLLGTVDTALMGRLSPLHIAAVGVGGMIFNFIYWNFGFLRMGTTGITAQAFGAEDMNKQAATLFQAIIVALSLALLVFIFSVPLMNIGGNLLNLEGEQLVVVKEYFFIRIWDAPATLMLYALMGWLFGMQNAWYPMLVTIMINVCNIALSYTLVIHYQLEIEGVAWGTVIAQYMGLVLIITLILIRYPQARNGLSVVTDRFWKRIRMFLTVNTNIFIRTLCLTLAFGIFYSHSSSLGSLLLATNVILLLFVNWMSYAVDGFAYAAESIVGKYKGRNSDTGLNKSIRLSFIWGGGIALLIGLCYLVFGNVFLQIFTDSPEVIALANEYLIWVVLFPVLAFGCYIWDGIYIGLTAVHAMRDAMIIAFLLFLGLLYTIGETFGNHGLWASLVAFMVFRGGIQWLFFARKGLAIR
ncbi:MAG: MATE family efflux transporter [Bacteroidia bacterium]|nr:MATE family efflux transporter [Bacteroidia bacterium]